MSDSDAPNGCMVVGVIAFLLVALLGYCALSSDCEKKGGTLLKDAMGMPKCVDVRSIK